MSNQVKITYYGLYREANRLLDKSKISLGEYERMIEPLNDEIHKVGRWIDTNMTCCGAKVYKCSVCDNEIDEMPTEEGEPIWNYCPNCGAYMKGE